MKALFTFFFIAFFCSFQLQAQAPDSLWVRKYQPVASAGVLLGVNVASLTNFNDYSSRIGVIAGLTGDLQLSELAGLMAELTYSQQGMANASAAYQLYYLKLPVMFTLQDHGFVVQGGLYYAYLLKGKTDAGKYSENVTKHFASSDTGLTIGLAYNFHGNTRLGLRYSQGFDNINKGIADPRLQYRNSTLQISGGYIF